MTTRELNKLETELYRTSTHDRKIAHDAAEFAYNNRRYTCDDIYKAYKNPSIYKVRAWQYCQRLCAELNGWDLIISAHGCQTFSVVFTYEHPETGVISYAYITRDYNRFCAK
jgi:hypothetical protein